MLKQNKEIKKNIKRQYSLHVWSIYVNTIATDTESEEHSEHKHYTYTKYTCFMPITKLAVNHTSQAL